MNDAEHKAFHVSAAELAAQAWDAVRGDDPEFKSCLPEFRSKLIFVAQSVIKTGRGGAVGLEAFEAEVKRLLAPETELGEEGVARLAAEAVNEARELAVPAGQPDTPENRAFHEELSRLDFSDPATPTPSDDARTLANADPNDPSDDATVSAAASRLSALREGGGGAGE